MKNKQNWTNPALGLIPYVLSERTLVNSYLPDRLSNSFALALLIIIQNSNQPSGNNIKSLI